MIHGNLLDAQFTTEKEKIKKPRHFAESFFFLPIRKDYLSPFIIIIPIIFSRFLYSYGL